MNLINKMDSIIDIEGLQSVAIFHRFDNMNNEAVYPGGGGYHLRDLRPFILPVEQRKLILIKGYHHWAGRVH